MCYSTVSDLYFQVISLSRMATGFPDIASVFRLQEDRIKWGRMYVRAGNCSSVKYGSMYEALGSNPNRVKKKVCQLLSVKMYHVCVDVCIHTCVCASMHVHAHICVCMYVYTCGRSSTMWAWVSVMVVSTWWSISLVCIIFFE